MRLPGVEPGSQAWEACMLLLHYKRSYELLNPGLYLRVLTDDTRAATPAIDVVQELRACWTDIGQAANTPICGHQQYWM